MSIKWLGDTNSNTKNGERLIVKYVHSGNTEYYISSADWTTSTLVLTAPHGIAVGVRQKVLVCPNYQDRSNPTRDLRSIPYEWIRTNNQALYLEGVDTTTVKVTNTSGVAWNINQTSVENNGNLNASLFHFESTIPWQIDNLPVIKRMRYKSYGYTSYGGDYRYQQYKILTPSGTISDFNSNTYINRQTLVKSGNMQSDNGLYFIDEMIVDTTISNIVLMETNGIYGGRRVGYGSLVFDYLRETNKIPLYVTTSEIEGIIAFRNYGLSSQYAYMANGHVVEIWDIEVIK